jgi:hypothetical protein
MHGFITFKGRRSGGMAQEIEYLPRRCEALSSKPSTTKNKIINKERKVHASIIIEV